MTTVTPSASTVSRPDDMTSQAVFRRLLSALSEPGRIVDLPALPGDAHPALAVPLTLGAPEVGVAVLTAGEEPVWARALADAVGTPTTSPEQADIVLALRPPTPDEVRILRRGTADAPELGARLVLACRMLTSDPADDSSAPGVRLELRGPGVPDHRTVLVNGIPVEVFEALTTANRGRPAGVDTLLVDDAGRCVGLPRSSRILATRQPSVPPAPTGGTSTTTDPDDTGGQPWATQR